MCIKRPRATFTGGTASGSGGVSALMKKKRKKRRDHTELREKIHTKHNKMWKGLMAPAYKPKPGEAEKISEKNRLLKEHEESRKNSAEAILKREQRQAKKEAGLEGSEDGLEMVVVVEKGVYIYVFLTFTY
jgi:hypothetical protein